MANYFITDLECSNPEVLKAFAKELGYEGSVDELCWWQGDTKFSVRTMNCIPRDAVKKISKQFPEDVITCGYCYEDIYSNEVYTMEYKAGRGNLLRLEPLYLYSLLPFNNDLDKDRIYGKAKDFFRRLDTTEKDKDGRLFIKWLDEGVTYKFDYDATDGKKYWIEATKSLGLIDFEVEELVEKNSQMITSTGAPDDVSSWLWGGTDGI